MKQQMKVLLGGVALMAVVAAAGCVDQQVKQHTEAAGFLTPSAKSKADHEAVAAHYEQAAAEATNKAELMKKHLALYEGEPWLYGKQKEPLITHCKSLIEKYSDIAKENQELAHLHKSIADRL